MKRECYFTPKTATSFGESVLKDLAGHGIRSRIPEHVHRPCLLVMDMQRWFLEDGAPARIPSAEAVISRVADLQASFLKGGAPVIQTRHLNRPGSAGQMEVWWERLIEESNPLSEIHAGVKMSSIPVVKKSQYDAFHETDLLGRLRAMGIGTLIVTGVMTHLCVETTARSAFVRGFEIIVPVETTATYREAAHRGTMMNLAHGFARVMTCPQLMNVLHSGGGER